VRWRWLSSFLIRLADHAIWLLVKALPGRWLIRLIRKRPWRTIGLRLPDSLVLFLLPRIRSLLEERCHQAKLGSSCLSRALLGRILLDLMDVPNQLHLGMNIIAGRGKVPHAWLIAEGREFTPGLDVEEGSRIFTM
jgi:hypothetical protein